MVRGSGGSLAVLHELVLGLLIFSQCGRTAPVITFPINSQVPPVARTSEHFSFSFSASTFSSSLAITYSLENAPSWLSLDGASRTLSGTPPASDANTAPVLQVVATDSSGSVAMSTTLVVLGVPAPTIEISLEDQLPKFGNYSSPSTILYYPSTPFSIKFDPKTFSSSASIFYAVTLDNSPLPSWVAFDPSSLTFSGQTPDSQSLIQPPQDFGLQLIASDVLGFSGIPLPFYIVVANHELTFVDESIKVNATIGKTLSSPNLRDTLRLDGNPVSSSDIASAIADNASWLSFDPSTFSLSGTPPANTNTTSITVTVTDIFGDIATTEIQITIATETEIFGNSIGPLNATIGLPFSFSLNSSLLNPSDVTLAATISPATSWLSFNAQSSVLSGTVPLTAQPSAIQITLQATSKSSLATEIESFVINVVRGSVSSSSSSSSFSSLSSSSSSPSSASSSSSSEIGSSTTISSTTSSIFSSATTITSSTPTSTEVAVATMIGNIGLSKGQLVAAILIPILFAFICTFLCILCLRRRRREQARSRTPEKAEISLPIMQILKPGGALAVDTNGQRIPSQQTLQAFFDSNRASQWIRRSQRSSAQLYSNPQIINDSGRLGSFTADERDVMSNMEGESWRTIIDGTNPNLRSLTTGASDGSSPTTRNFSRKTPEIPQLSQMNFDFGMGSTPALENTLHKYDSRTSGSSTYTSPPEHALSPSRPRKLQKSSSQQQHAAKQTLIKRLSGVGHGVMRSPTGSSRSGFSARNSRSTGGIGHGRRTDSGHAGPVKTLTRATSSWITTHTQNTKGNRPPSVISAVSEDTDLLFGGNSQANQRSIRTVPRSPATFTRSSSRSKGSVSSRFARPVSRRTGGDIAFFGGSSRESSKSRHKKPPRPKRSHEGLVAPAIPDAGTTNSKIERSIMRELRNVAPRPPEGMQDEPRDSLGISYGTPRQGTRQLTSFVNSVNARNSWDLPSSQSHFSDDDEDSRYRSAEISPTDLRRVNKEEGEWEDDEFFDDLGRRALERDSQALSRLSKTSKNSLDRQDTKGTSRVSYRHDESPELGEAVAAPSVWGSVSGPSSGTSPYQEFSIKERLVVGPNRRPISVESQNRTRFMAGQLEGGREKEDDGGPAFL